jgi:hypothetical protein
LRTLIVLEENKHTCIYNILEMKGVLLVNCYCQCVTFSFKGRQRFLVAALSLQLESTYIAKVRFYQILLVGCILFVIPAALPIFYLFIFIIFIYCQSSVLWTLFTAQVGPRFLIWTQIRLRIFMILYNL